jgi:hypothetical protein
MEKERRRILILSFLEYEYQAIALPTPVGDMP